MSTKAKARRTKRINLEAASSNLLLRMRILRKDFPKEHDKSYDSIYLESLDRGGLSYVAPTFLGWAKHIMKIIRASISQRSIRKSGRQAQKDAYSLVQEDKVGHRLFEKAVSNLPGKGFSEDVILYARKAVLNYAFHARSEVEWKKFRAVTTDRSAGKDKKKSLRTILK